jgi:hypothetical protein
MSAPLRTPAKRAVFLQEGMAAMPGNSFRSFSPQITYCFIEDGPNFLRRFNPYVNEVFS